MSKRDWILTLVIVVIWGTNFTITKIGISNVPPMLLAALRFIFVAFPAVFFVKRPQISWFYTVGYASTIGVGQYCSEPVSGTTCCRNMTPAEWRPCPCLYRLSGW